MELKVVNTKGEEVSVLTVSDAVFGAEYNEALIHQVVVAQLANKRQGTKSTLTRTEVRGGGIKPWRQKGTGRARQGSIRATQWIKGGIALGPKPRDYSYTLNKKLKRVALKSALSAKVLEDEIKVVEDMKVEGYKTSVIANMLKSLDVNSKALIVTCDKDDLIVKSARNIKGVTPTFVNVLNVYDILSHDQLIIAKEAIAKIEEVFA